MADDANRNEEAVVVTITEEENKPKEGAVQVATMALKKTTDQVKNNIIGILAILTLLLSLPLLASFIWLLFMRYYDCENLLGLPRLQTGICIGLIFVFFISNGVVFMRARFPVPGLLVVMVPLIVMLVMGLALVGAYTMESRSIPATPLWLKFEVNSNENWNNIKSCIYETKECDDLVSRSLNDKSYDFSMSKLTAIESGCCRPPVSCDMEYVNATFWRKEDKGTADDESEVYDSDCDTWRNDRNIFCYNCQSCKEGFLKTLKGKWEKLGIFLTVMALLLIIFHISLFIATMLESFQG